MGNNFPLDADDDDDGATIVVAATAAVIAGAAVVVINGDGCGLSNRLFSCIVCVLGKRVVEEDDVAAAAAAVGMDDKLVCNPDENI